MSTPEGSEILVAVERFQNTKNAPVEVCERETSITPRATRPITQYGNLRKQLKNTCNVTYKYKYICKYIFTFIIYKYV